jgi:hypothetical protein
MQNKQYKHTNLLLYCSKKFYTFNQVSNKESEQRNFTHLIRCQTMKVKPYIILNTSRKHVNYEEVPMNKPYNIQNTNICNGIFHISFFKALLINEGEQVSVWNDPDSVVHNFFLNTIKKYKIWKYSVFSILLQNIKYCNKDLLTD